MKKILWLIIALSLFCVSIFAAPGDLDTTFDFDGMVVTPMRANVYGYATAIQTDGKILVAGYANDGTGNDFAVVRYNTDGSLDTTFDLDGKVRTQIGTDFDQAYAIALQTDGKILVAGNSGLGSSSDFAVVRYNTDGSLDTTFDSDGIVTTSVGTQNSGYSIALQTDGKILVAGEYWSGSSYDFAVVRYNTDGSLDTSFDSDGKVTTPVGTSHDYARTVTVQSDGKIVVVGRNNVSSTDFDIAVVRYNSDGSLDTSFDSDGITTTDVGGFQDLGEAVEIQADGKILVGGSAHNGSYYDFSVVRYNPDGSLDTTFDSDGKVTTTIHSIRQDFGRAIKVQANGKIVVGGQSDGKFAAVRYNADGSLDNSLWGTNGIVTAQVYGYSYGQAMAIDSAGRVIVAGYSYDGVRTSMAVARFINFSPTAATATISGQVLSSGKGRGVSGAIVHLTDQEGNIQTARTNPFGYYRFADVEVGQTLLLNVFSKQYQFDARVVNFDGSLTGFDFMPQLSLN